MATRRCAYCGTATLRAVACQAHADLPALDPHYARELRQPTDGVLRDLRPPRKAAAAA